MSKKMTTESSDPGRQGADEREDRPRDDQPRDASSARGEEAESEGARPGPAERIAELEQRAADLKDKWLRATADLENHRRRSRRDVEDARADGKKRALTEVLPVVDNLERALQHAEGASSEEAKGIADGVSLVMRQFAQALDRLDVKPIEAEGEPFDPAFHEAMSQIESDELPPGSIAQVLQRGYTLGDKLLRPALVVVAKAAPESGAGAGPNGKAPDDAGDGDV